MPDRFSSFIAIIQTFLDEHCQDFSPVEVFFFREIITDKDTDRLPIIVEIHRLVKLIKGDVALLKASRSAIKHQKFQQQILERSEKLIEFCRGLG